MASNVGSGTNAQFNSSNVTMANSQPNASSSSRAFNFFCYMLNFVQKEKIEFNMDVLLNPPCDFLLRQRSKDRDVIGVLKETQELFASAANDVDARICRYSAFGTHAGATAPQFNNASHAFRLVSYMVNLVKGSGGKLTFQMNVLLDTSACARRIRTHHSDIPILDLLKQLRKFLTIITDKIFQRMKQLEQEELTRPKPPPAPARVPVKAAPKVPKPAPAPMSEHGLWMGLIKRAHKDISYFALLDQGKRIAQLPSPDASRPCHISKLPDEILLHIFMLAYLAEVINGYRGETEPTSSTHAKFSKVNRRFRRIILSTPFFWSRISSTMDVDNVSKTLERAGSAPLTVNIWYTEGSGEEQLQEFLDVATKLAPRWKSFIFGMFANDYGSNVGVLQDIEESFPDLELPSLETLYLCFEEIGMFSEEITPLSAFYKKWSLVKLRDITAINTIPSFNVAPPLVSLDIALKTVEQEGEYKLAPLAALLQNSPLLEHLRLELTNFDVDSDEKSTPAFKDKKIELPNLTEFDIWYLSPSSDTVAVLKNQFLRLVDALEFPTLRKAKIYAGCGGDEALPSTGPNNCDFVQRTIRPFERSSSLAEFEMRLDVTFDPPLDESPLHTILTRLTYLQTLRISGDRGFTPCKSNSASRLGALPPLEKIHLTKCTSVKTALLHSVLERIRDGEHADAFRELVVQGKSSLEKEEVVKMLGECASGGAKLVWDVEESAP